MLAVRILSATVFLAVAIYTIVTVNNNGFDLVTPYLSDLFAFSWSGQFNLDFGCYLLLSAVWFVWRNEYSTASLLFSPLVLTGGMLVFAAYLFVLSFKADDRIDVLLLGRGRVRRLGQRAGRENAGAADESLTPAPMTGNAGHART